MTDASPSAIVTGAFGALGSEVARTLVRHAYRVALVGIERAAPPALAAEFGAPNLIFAGVDITDVDTARDVFDVIATRLGGIDALVNVAGGFAWQPVASGNFDTWEKMFAMNLKTAVVASQSALRHLRRDGTGRIVNIGAGAALHASAGVAAYAASKAGVLRLTESLAEELRDEGITVNAILPGTIDTPANRRDMPDADRSRWVEPAAIADVIAFLLSPAARAVNGAAIRVAGRG